MQVDGKGILKQGEGYYFTTLPHYDVRQMKEYTINMFSLEPSALVTIQNVQPITKEFFEKKTGKPFFL
jgi:hypothetical protein